MSIDLEKLRLSREEGLLGSGSIVETFKINHGYQVLGRTLEHLVDLLLLGADRLEAGRRGSRRARWIWLDPSSSCCMRAHCVRVRFVV